RVRLVQAVGAAAGDGPAAEPFAAETSKCDAVALEGERQALAHASGCVSLGCTLLCRAPELRVLIEPCRGGVEKRIARGQYGVDGLVSEHFVEDAASKALLDGDLASLQVGLAKRSPQDRRT